MQDYIYLHKSPQKNSISIRQNDNTLIITYFLYSPLLSHQVRFLRILRILRICKFSKFAVFAIFARYLARSVLIYDNLNNIWRAPTLRLPSENITPQHSLATRKTKSYLRLIIGLSSGKALDK